MCTKSNRPYIWVLCLTLLIGIFVVYISSYFDLSSKRVCSVDPNISSEVDFKRNSADKLSDNISKNYIEMLRRIHPTKQAYWKSLLSDLSRYDEHTPEIQSVLKEWSKNFEHMKKTYNKKERLYLIALAQYHDEKLHQLSQKGTVALSMDQFNIIRQNNNLKKYHQYKETEAIHFVNDIYESWSDLYDCVPEIYQNKFEVLDDVEEMFQSTLTSSDSDKMFKIHKLLSKLDSVFISGFKLSL